MILHSRSNSAHASFDELLNPLCFQQVLIVLQQLTNKKPYIPNKHYRLAC